MAEQIDELFVKLGLDTDEKEFQQANQQFSQLETRALQFGAAIASGFGLQELTFGVSETVNEANKLADVFEGLGVTPQFVDQLKGAFQLIDEDASEAETTIRGIADLIENTDWGDIPDDAFKRLGFDPRILENVDSVAEGLRLISESVQDMDQETARRALSDIGLGGDAQVRLLQSGNVEDLLSRSQDLSPLTDEMSQAAREFQEGFASLSRSMEGLSRVMSEEFVGELGEGMGNIADAIAENRKAIVDALEEWGPVLKDIAMAVGLMAAYRAARAGLGILSKIPFATTAAVAGVIAVRENERRQDREREENFGTPGGTGKEPVNPDAPVGDIPSLNESMGAEDIRGMMRNMGGLGNDQSNVINIDARGSDPSAVGQNVERAIKRTLPRLSENAVINIRGTS